MPPKKASKTEYTGIPYGTDDAELSVPAALVQAAQALDVAAEVAAEIRDTKTLMRVAAMWMSMADWMGDGGSHEKHDEPEPPAGFQQREREITSIHDETSN